MMTTDKAFYTLKMFGKKFHEVSSVELYGDNVVLMSDNIHLLGCNEKGQIVKMHLEDENHIEAFPE